MLSSWTSREWSLWCVLAITLFCLFNAARYVVSTMWWLRMDNLVERLRRAGQVPELPKPVPEPSAHPLVYVRSVDAVPSDTQQEIPRGREVAKSVVSQLVWRLDAIVEAETRDEAFNRLVDYLRKQTGEEQRG